jgi:imidazolonepropionase-like amidohydrolase
MKQALLIALWLTALPCWGQPIGSMPKTEPAVFALKNATVVVGNGQVLSPGTVVLREGLIEAVGADAAVPPAAWEMELAGKYVYPGLIDGLTEVALKKPAGRSQPGAPESPPAETPSLLADVRAADLVDPESKPLPDWRNAGLLALHVAPDQGVFRGQTVLINLNGRELRSMMLQSTVASRVSFEVRGRRSYPASLMGAIAFVRQTLLDARRYAEAHDVYATHPLGLARPETDRALEALGPVIRGGMPLIVSASLEREIARAIQLAQELKVRCIVAGGFEADHLVELLRAVQTPLLVSLNFPEKSKEAHPEAEETLEVVRRRMQAPRCPAALEKAGLSFGFCSDGVKTPRDFLKNLRRTVREGLSKEAALRACTLNVAQILGVDRQLGSIEKGKIANLLVADGDLFAEKTKILQVFVDGEVFPVPEEKDVKSDAAQPGASAPEPGEGGMR